MRGAWENACLVTARDFLTFDPQYHPEWHDKTLFIDGLDEIRVGANDARTPFNQIRGRFDVMRNPRFRLSCREADLARGKRSEALGIRLAGLQGDSSAAQSPDGFGHRDILNARPDINDADAFIAAAEERGVEGLLANPQTLKMLADVVAQGGGWPKSRKETFERACEQMVRDAQRGTSSGAGVKQSTCTRPAP